MEITAGYWKIKFAQWLANGELDALLPEVAALRGVSQPEEHHPEGDVFEHTLQAMAAVDDSDDQRVFWAVLLHDIGKAWTTEFSEGKWRAHGHSEAGSEKVPGILGRFGLDDLAENVTWLVRHHQYKLSWNLKPGDILTQRQTRFTLNPLFSLLQKVCAADREGRKAPESKVIW